MHAQSSLKSLAGAVLDRTIPRTLPAQYPKTARTLGAHYQTSLTHCNSQKTDSFESLEIEMIRAWLFKIDEPEEEHHLVLDKCRNDPDALQYFLQRASGENFE
ncbi:hypothetical protein [Nitrosomonas sp.]|uniref:hypothetical protein n=1 Tax=Nitrosomonas sp. TaxID=42353 RepID=UPI001DF9A93A|nr:hypothetical protein [Nitrosomonas sp.]MBX3616987.1 hypothetical protein [Nitrosomonas sp.]